MEPPRPLQGWLFKRGAHRGAKAQGAKGWKYRWFTFDEERERLLYSGGPGKPPKGAIDVADVNFVAAKARLALDRAQMKSLSAASRGNRPKIFRFEVASGVGRGGRTFHLGAETAEECDRWLRHLLLRCRRRSLLLLAGGLLTDPNSGSGVGNSSGSSGITTATGSHSTAVLAGGSHSPDSVKGGEAGVVRRPSALSLFASYDDWGSVAFSPSTLRSTSTSPSTTGSAFDLAQPQSSSSAAAAAAEQVWKDEALAAIQQDDFETRACAIAALALRVRTQVCEPLIEWCIREHGEAIVAHPDDAARREWARLFRNAAASEVQDATLLRLLLRLLVRLAQAGNGMGAIESRLAALDALRQWAFLHVAAATAALDSNIVADAMDVLRTVADEDNATHQSRLDSSEVKRWLDLLGALSYSYAIIPVQGKKSKGDRDGFLSTTELKELERLLKHYFSRRRRRDEVETNKESLPADIEAILAVIRTNMAARSSGGLGGFRRKAASRLFSFRSSDTLDSSHMGDTSGLPTAQAITHTESTPSWLTTFIKAVNIILRPPVDGAVEHSRITVEDIILPLDAKPDDTHKAGLSAETTNAGGPRGISLSLSGMCMPSSGTLAGRLRFLLGSDAAVVCSIAMPGTKEACFVRITDLNVEANVMLGFAPHARSPSRLSFDPSAPPVVTLRIQKVASHAGEIAVDSNVGDLASLEDLCVRTVEAAIADHWTAPNALDLFGDSLGALFEEDSLADDDETVEFSPVQSVQSSFLRPSSRPSGGGSRSGSQAGPPADSAYQEIAVVQKAAGMQPVATSTTVSGAAAAAVPQKKKVEYDYLPGMPTPTNLLQEPPSRATPPTPTGEQELSDAQRQREAWQSRTHSDPAQCVILFQFFAEGPKELTLRVGDLVKVTLKHSSGWWRGQISNATGTPKAGYFPANFAYQ